MPGTAFDAILANIGAAASIKAQTSQMAFQRNFIFGQARLQAMQSMLNSQYSQNPTETLAHAVLSQVAPPSVSGVPADNTAAPGSKTGSIFSNIMGHAMDAIVPAGFLVNKLTNDTSAGQSIVKQFERPVSGIGQALHDATQPGANNNPIEWAKSIGQGFMNPKYMPSTVLDQGILKNAPDPVQFFGGLAADIALDPLTYINPQSALERSGVKAGAEAGIKAGETAKVAEVAKDATPTAVIPTQPTSEALIGKLVDRPSANALTPFTPPRFAAGPNGIISDTANPVNFADHVAASEIHSGVTAAPKLAHPELNVDPLFHTVTNETVQRIPKQITEEVQVPLDTAPKVAAAAKATAAMGDTTGKLAELRAVKMHLLQASEYKIHGFTVDQLLDTAKNNPDRAADIDKMFNTEAMKIYKSKDYSELPKVAVLRGRSGKPGAAGLNLDQATELFKHGKVAKMMKDYSENTDAITHNFPLHDPEDLDVIHLKNSKGEVVPLKQYLTELGIPVAAVDAKTGVEKLLNKVAPKKPEPGNFTFDFEKKAEVPATKTVKRTRTVFEDVRQTSTSSRKLNKAEQLRWQIAHQDKLTPQELTYLKSARTPKQFEDRLGELRTKTVAGNIKSLNEFIDAAKAGVIPKDYLDELLKRVGVSSLEQLESRATAIIKKTGNAAKAKFVDKELTPGIVERTRLPEEAAPVAKKAERSKAKETDSIWNSVPTASQLIEAAKESPAVLMKDLPEVTNVSLEDLARALPESIVKNLVDPQDVSKYPFLSGKKLAKRTHQQLGEGRARNLKGWNKYSQYDMWKSLVGSASKRNYTSGLQGKELAARLRVRPSIMYNEVMSGMKLGEAALKKAGVKFIAGDQNSGIMMSLTDVLDSIDRKTVEKFLFTTGKNVKRVEPTTVLDAAERLVDATLHGGNMDMAKEVARRSLMAGGLDEAKSAQFMDALNNALPKIVENVNKNYAQHSIEIGTAVQSMSDEVIHNVITQFADPNVSVGDAFKSIIDRGSTASKIGASLKAPAEAGPIAKTLIDTELASQGVVNAGDLAEAKTSTVFKTTKTTDELRKAGVAQQKSREAEAMTMGQAAGESVDDLGDYFEHMIQAGIYRANAPLAEKFIAVQENLAKMFIGGYGFQDIHENMWSAKNFALSRTRDHRSLMSVAAKIAGDTYGSQASEKIQEAFKLVQQGAQIQDPAMQHLMSAIKSSVDIMWAGGDTASFAARNGFFTEHLNSLLEYYGVPKVMRFDEGKPLSEQSELWRSWTDVKDPLDALDKVHAAYQAATTDVTVARNFSASFGSAVQKPGFVKLTDKSGNSKLFNYIDHDLYYPREIAQQIPYYDRIRNMTYTSAGNSNFSAMLRVYDKALQAFKTGVTILRPGHHVSNLQGDMILNFLAGVNNPAAYYKSIRVLKGRSSMYLDWDAQKALAEGTGIPESIAKGGKIKVAGKSISDDEVWRGAYMQGLLPEFHEIQDITFNEQQNFGKLYSTSKLKNAGKKVLHVAGKTADAESHFTRMAQFIDLLEKSKTGSVAEAMDAAGAAVRKWHPDGTDLTPFERKVMKRIIPFYSWMRKSTPLIIQSLAMKPGRAMVVPKVMYNLAETMGMDPNSISDPFSPESLLPSWIAGSVLGPQWTGSDGHQLGMTLPGDPVTGTLNGPISNPISTLLNGITPFAKVPVELASGHNLATGAPIGDKSSYINQQIPLLSIASNISNKTLTPSGLTDQQDVKKGRQAPGMDNLALLNLMTGLGVKDYSNISNKKAAIAELRQQYRDKVFSRR